jgi:uncharacterized membrane protein YqjE
MAIEKSIHTIAHEIIQFVATRTNLLKSEMQEKGQTLRRALPALCIAGLLLLTGWVVLTFTLVAVVHYLFVPNAYSWAWASLVVGVGYLLLGGGIAHMTLREIKATHFAPTRTLTVLKQDRAWIENEVRTA